MYRIYIYIFTCLHLNIFLSVVAILHFLLRLLSYPQHRYAQVERLAFGYR